MCGNNRNNRNNNINNNNKLNFLRFYLDLFSTKKKDKGRPRFSPDTSGLRGAVSWRVVAEDCSTRHEVSNHPSMTSHNFLYFLQPFLLFVSSLPSRPGMHNKRPVAKPQILFILIVSLIRTPF